MIINLTKKDIVNSLYMQVGFSKKISENLLEDLINIIIDNLVQNKSVKISKFGTFAVRTKNSRVGRNPKTKEDRIISKRKVALFKASKDFKNYVNKNEKI